VEIPFRTRKCTPYMMRTLSTTMSLPTSKLLWERGTYVMRVSLYTTKHASVTQLALSVRLYHPVRKIRQSIAVHATGGS